jgi:hypothetical protein
VIVRGFLPCAHTGVHLAHAGYVITPTSSIDLAALNPGSGLNFSIRVGEKIHRPCVLKDRWVGIRKN